MMRAFSWWGVLSENGATDTWLMRDGADKFEPLLRKTCNTRPFSVAAEILNGRVYAIGTVWNEAQPRFFRANDLATLNEPIPSPAPRPHGGGGGGGGGTAAYAPVPAPEPAPASAPEDTPCPKDASCPISAISDASPTEWYHDEVHWALEQGIMNGIGKNQFDSNGTTTRAMVVTMLCRLEGEPGGKTSFFTDVPADARYTKAVNWGAETGVVKEITGTEFAPDAPVTREQQAAILYHCV